MIINKNILLKNFSWLFIEKITRMASVFLVNLLVIRYINLADYGLLNYGLAINLFLIAILTHFRDNLIKVFNDKKEISLVIFNLLICLRIFVAILLCFFFYLIFQKDFSTYLIIISSIINLSDLCEYYFHSKNKMKEIVIIKIITYLIFGTLKIIALVLYKSYELFCFLFVIESIFLNLLSFTILFKEVKLKFSKFKKREFEIFKMFLLQSFPLLLNSILTVSYMRFDQIIIKKYLGNNELGFYSLIININEVVQSIPFIISLSLAPTLFSIKFRNLNFIKIEKYLKLLFILGIILILLSNLGFFILCKILDLEIINVWIMPLVSIGTLITFQSYFISKIIMHSGYLKQFMKRSLVVSFISIVLNIWLIPKFGLLTCAIVYLLSQWYIGFWSNFLLPEKDISKTQLNSFRRLLSLK